MTREVCVKDLARALEGAHRRSEALLDALRALQRATSSDEEESPSELKEALTNLIIMRTRLNERQSVLPGLLREASEHGFTSVVLSDDIAQRLGLR